MKTLNITFSLLLLLLPFVSGACDLCGCFVPNETLRHGLQLGFSEQYSSFSDLSLDGNELNNTRNQYLNSSYTQLFANFHFNERTALQLNVPLIYRSFQRVESGSLQSGRNSGLGDLLLVGYYVPFQRKNPFSQFNWKLIGGIKFPTGNSDSIAEELNESHTEEPIQELSGVHGHDIALGTGSWDVVLGTDVYGRHGRAFYEGQLQYALRSHGSFDYKYGNDLLWIVGPGYYISTSHSWPIGIQGVLSGEYKVEDELGNQKADDTAITAVYLGPTASVGISNLATAEFGIGFPLMIHNSGLQNVPSYRLRAGITWRFK